MALMTAVLASHPARAGDPWEIWPELNLFKQTGPTSRLYLVAAYANGKESAYQTLDLAAYFDLTFRPFVRDAARDSDWRHDQDWRAKRYLWIRIGYDHVGKASSDGTKSTPENRGIIAAHARAYLPAEILLEGRVRADLRWIGGDYSTRYRLRGEVNRDFNVFGTVATPYLQIEFFYDTRYDGWARALYQVGAEVAVTRHLRLEPYFARQADRLPEREDLNAAGFVVKWYY